jgi:hypothetical protein
VLSQEQRSAVPQFIRSPPVLLPVWVCTPYEYAYSNRRVPPGDGEAGGSQTDRGVGTCGDCSDVRKLFFNLGLGGPRKMGQMRTPELVLNLKNGDSVYGLVRETKAWVRKGASGSACVGDN